MQNAELPPHSAPLSPVGELVIRSDRHQFLVLLAAHLVDLFDVFVGEVLNVLFRLLLVVFGQLTLLLRLLDKVDRVAADIADGNLGVFAVFFDLFGQLFSALLGQLRENQADDFCGLMPRSET